MRAKGQMASSTQSPQGSVELAARLPGWAGSIRFRLMVLYSVLLFGLATIVEVHTTYTEEGVKTVRDFLLEATDRLQVVQGHERVVLYEVAAARGHQDLERKRRGETVVGDDDEGGIAQVLDQGIP